MKTKMIVGTLGCILIYGAGMIGGVLIFKYPAFHFLSLIPFAVGCWIVVTHLKED